ncbi:MAG: hypothetical protein UT77_C0016G0036 [Candidatus Daviesbacteria bacterium GW2011_GWC2_40_12]|uniref:Uncharacterized protein n=1 Tax=Candidatus Daviesbacteria bacterium GW2011_GWC2_40_12 TaxID=1618431 RepID=A0A0G0TT45_9BACT|nr:MAG: hypothetical protein UT77_C0016G0036 [Candidatus Daviesbacteria bacterium GW2011_GWC2_40_12]
MAAFHFAPLDADELWQAHQPAGQEDGGQYQYHTIEHDIDASKGSGELCIAQLGHRDQEEPADHWTPQRARATHDRRQGDFHGDEHAEGAHRVDEQQVLGVESTHQRSEHCTEGESSEFHPQGVDA